MRNLRLSIRQFVVCAATILAACGDAGNVTGGDPSRDPSGMPDGPGDPGGDPGKPSVVTPDMEVAIADNSPTAHVLFVGRLDGALRNQLHFNGVADLIPGNLPLLPVSDDRLLGLASPSLSPDGTQLAVVVTVAPHQSEIVVMNADGAGAQVASSNHQIVVDVPAWSHDGTKLAYAMSTQLDTTGVDLFVTDLKTHAVTRLTTNADVKATAVRWSADGKSVYYARHTGTTTDVSHNWISEVIKVDVTTGAAQTVASNVTGDISSIAPSATRMLVTRTVASGAGTTVQLIERTLGATEQIVVASDAVNAHYLSGADDLAVVVTNVLAGVHVTNETVVMNLQTKAALSVVGTGSSTSVDAFNPLTRP